MRILSASFVSLSHDRPLQHPRACWRLRWQVISVCRKKNAWLHDGFIALSGTLSDLKVQVLTFGGDPSPLDDNLYLLNARMVFTSSPDVDEDQPVLQLFVNDVRIFIVTLCSIYLICCQEVQEIPPGNRMKPVVIFQCLTLG